MADNQGLFAITAEQREELQGWAQSGRLRQTGPSANDELADWSRAYQLFRGNVAYVWHAGVHAAEVARGLEAAGLRIRAQIVGPNSTSY